MNPTLNLLRVIGSPFVSERELPNGKEEALEQYNYATKNKIGLAYLESLKSRGKLEEFELKPEYEEEQKKHNEQVVTTIRISELFNSFGVNYAIFKSIMPFPATPNDVDIIHFGSDEEYGKAAETMLRSDYIEVEGQADAEQRMFHDSRDGELSPHPNKKDVYDVDVYHKISASYVLYLDKRKLEKYVSEISISNNRLKVLKPEAELVTIIIHSIIPEMLCTLFVYYATIHYMDKMNSKDIRSFIDVAKENKVLFSVKAHCSLIAELHNAAHGFVPEKIEKILSELGEVAREKKILLDNGFRMPHKYSLFTIAGILIGKSRETTFGRSLIKQMLYMLISPRLSKWVISEIIWRRRRETY